MYEIIISDITYQKLTQYLFLLKSKIYHPGNKLGYILKTQAVDITNLTAKNLLELILSTKKFFFVPERKSPLDWNMVEISILSNISFVADVEIYDSGCPRRKDTILYKDSFNGTLIFTPPVILTPENDDFNEVIIPQTKEIDDNKFSSLYERRLLPSFLEANNKSDTNGIIVTISTFGIDNLYEYYTGSVEVLMQNILKSLLTKYAEKLPNIKAVIFDIDQHHSIPKCELGTVKINTSMSLITVAGLSDKKAPHPLQHPSTYGEQYANCRLCSLVEWDPFSIPGNDYYIYELLESDEAIKTASTNLLSIVTGSQGQYNEQRRKFLPNTRIKFQTISLKASNLRQHHISDTESLKAPTANIDSDAQEFSTDNNQYSTKDTSHEEVKGHVARFIMNQENEKGIKSHGA